MSNYPVHVNFPGRLVIVGFGSIGQGVLPLILRHVGITTDRITILTADDPGAAEAAEYGIKFIKQPLTRENFKRVLDPLVGRGDFLLNLSVDVSSLALIKFCWENAALYLDTCIEPWPGGYTDPTISPAKRTNYSLREDALALRDGKTRPTAVLTHGANPGLVSHFVKQALLNLAGDLGLDAAEPASREEWGRLAQKLGVKVIHIAERDTQVGEPAEGARRVRQHLVGRRLRRRGLAARRARLGLAREELAARRQETRLRARQRDLPDAARRGYPRAHLDAACGPVPRLPDHARRIDLDLRLPDDQEGRPGRIPPDRALRLSPVRRRRAFRARARRAQLAAAGPQARS